MFDKSRLTVATFAFLGMAGMDQTSLLYNPSIAIDHASRLLELPHWLRHAGAGLLPGTTCRSLSVVQAHW
jgi:hypothetical protein